MVAKNKVNVVDNNDYRGYQWTPNAFEVEVLSTGATCLMTSCPDNCSMVILSSISGLDKEDIESIISFLEVNTYDEGTNDFVDTACTSVQVTVNNKIDQKLFESCGFETLSSYISKGSGNTIHIMLYTFT